MTDIVERLRNVFPIGLEGEMRHEAADEIERLREALIRERHGWQAEVERLRREVMLAGGVHG